MTQLAALLRARWLCAFGVGAGFSAAALAAERLAFGHPFWSSLPAYALLGGFLAAAAAAVASPGGRRLGTAALLCGAAALPCLVALYEVNVSLLPGEPFSTPKSLLADGLVALAFGLLILVGARPLESVTTAGPLQSLLGLTGAVAAAASLLTITTNWPTTETVAARGAGTGPDLLLIVADSVRADHTSLHGYARATTPALDARAAQARVFESAYAASSWTAPAIDWIFDSPAGVLGARLPVLLARHGYLTACFTDNPHLGRGAELTAGFDVVRRSVGPWRRSIARSVLGETVERLSPGNDAGLVAAARGWLESVRGPVFLYVHLMDAHAPYDEPPIDGETRPGRRIEFPVSGMALSRAEAEDLVARYDAGVRSTDAAIGSLLEAAELRGRPFVAVVTADHGDSLGEAGRWFHGKSVAQELLAVPMLVIGQGVEPGRPAGPVGFDSVARTLLVAAGIACPDCPGSDLRTSVSDARIEGALPPHTRFRIAGRYKLVVRSDAPPRLFDLSLDPLETIDVAAQHPELVVAMSEGLRDIARVPRPAREDVERLKSLGYTAP